MNLVSDLLSDSGARNVGALRDLLLPIDVAAILRQPLGRGDADFWPWDPERFGVYTVRSAYKLIYKNKWEGSFGQQPSSSNDVLWRKVWKLDVPPKVRVFWWRVLHEFLPTKKILHRRHVEPLAFL